jgi:hypothetical protein
MSELVTCSMCGYRFDPQAHLACQSCPVSRGCQVICCPSCGYQWADPRSSVLARFAARWLSPPAPADPDTSNLSERKPF